MPRLFKKFMNDTNQPAKLDDLIGPTWENPELTSLNKIPSRSQLLPYSSLAKAIESRYEDNPWILSLDGDWSFELYESPSKLPTEALSNCRAQVPSQTLKVPGNWEFQGITPPHYTNLEIPFTEEPPFVQAENPTGLYQKSFKLPQKWGDRRVIIEFEGVQGVLQVYLNGRFIGLSKDAMTTASFELSEHLQEGHNLLALVVIKWSDATFIEDQDQWWTTGIFRSVRLVTTATEYIRDIKAVPRYDVGQASGSLEVEIPVFLGRRAKDGYTVNAMLIDPKGMKVSPEDWLAPVGANLGALAKWPRIGARLELEIPNVDAWTAETPNLYTLAVELKSEDKSTVEALAFKVGFREILVKDRNFLVNGRRVLIRGINRHEFDPVLGKVQTEERIREDLHLLKRHHFNAIRTAHYPNTPLFYEICDELGFYVWDEANVEAHAFHNHLCHEPRYTRAFFERVENMVRRDKNHACVVVWSLGNESGYGPAHDASAGWIRGYDSARPVHCEGAISQVQSQRQWTDGHRVTDVIGPMYARIHRLKEWATDSTDPRPMVLSEYAHSMGNSNGSLSDYWHVFRTCPGIQGGFIWEFCDHGILQKTESGESYFAYGGDFGDHPNDGNFACSGIVNSDRLPQPAWQEAKYCQQPVQVDFSEWAKGKIRIRSLQYFTNLDWLKAKWTLLEDGHSIATEFLSELTIAPESEQSFSLNLPPIDELYGELILQVDFLAAAEDTFFSEGDEVAQTEHLLRDCIPSVPTRSSICRIKKENAVIRLELGELVAEYSQESGALCALNVGIHSLLKRPVEPLAWRAPTDNDGIKLWSGQEKKDLGRWRAAGLDQLKWALKSLEIHEGNEGCYLVIDRIGGSAKLENAFEWKQTVVPSENNALLIQNDVHCHADLPNLPRLGERIVFESSFESLRYYGRGPFENYPDRKSAARLGIYSGDVAGEYFPYAMPQEHGNHCDTRWLTLSDKSIQIKVQAIDQHFAFSASHYDLYELTRATHTHEIKPQKYTFLHIDRANAPIGSASVGPGPLDQYCIHPKEYSWSYLLSHAHIPH